MTVLTGLRSFNDTGLHHFEQRLAGKDAEERLDALDDAFSDPVSGTGPLTIREFDNARDLAEAVLQSLGLEQLFPHLDDIGLWAWLTFVLREKLFKKNPDGSRQLGEFHRWYPSAANDWQKGQRHLVRMPVFLLAALGENADHLLCSAPNVLPEIREQMTGQNDMMTPAFQGLARALYFDPDTGRLKRGAGGKEGGSPRRLRTLRRQLEVTWQIDDLSLDQILAKLPKEFDRYR